MPALVFSASCAAAICKQAHGQSVAPAMPAHAAHLLLPCSKQGLGPGCAKQMSAQPCIAPARRHAREGVGQAAKGGVVAGAEGLRGVSAAAGPPRQQQRQHTCRTTSCPTFAYSGNIEVKLGSM